MNGKKRFSQRWSGGILCLCTVVLLSGCAVSKPGKSDTRAILDGSKSLVLFRVTSVERGASAAPKPLKPTINIWDVHQSFSNKWDRETCRLLDRSFSKDAATNGWRYLVLSPGTYFLQFDDDGHGRYNPSGRSIVSRRNEEVAFDQGAGTNAGVCYAFDRHPRTTAFALHVPAGTPVVYAGSFQATNWIEEVPDWPPGFYVNRKIAHLGDPHDEGNLAKQIVSEGMPELGEAHSVIATPFDYPPTPVAAAQMDIHPTNASGYSTSGVGTKPAAWAAAPLAFGGLAILSANDYDDDSNSSEDGAGMLAGAALTLAAAAIYEGVDATVGHAIRKKWAPHEAALVKEFQSFGLEQQLAQSVNAHMTNAASEAGNGYSLQVQPYRSCLRETRPGKYALELAVCVKLIEANSSNVIWENFLVHSDRNKAMKTTGNFLQFPFETLLASTSHARPLKQYTGEAGVQNFHDDLVKAVDGVATEIAARLK